MTTVCQPGTTENAILPESNSAMVHNKAIKTILATAEKTMLRFGL